MLFPTQYVGDYFTLSMRTFYILKMRICKHPVSSKAHLWSPAWGNESLTRRWWCYLASDFKSQRLRSPGWGVGLTGPHVTEAFRSALNWFFVSPPLDYYGAWCAVWLHFHLCIVTRAANVKSTKYPTVFCREPSSHMLLLCQSGGHDLTCAGTELTFAKSGRRALEQHISIARVGCNLQLLLSVLFNYEILLA